MRQPARIKSRRGQVSRTHSGPAPIKGWNSRDSVAAMRPDEALQLTNWFPTSSDVQLRKGSATHATGIADSGAAQVETLISYRPPSGNHELWAFAGTKLFDASSVGAIGAATVTGLTNARWQALNFTTAGGNFVIAVNGADELSAVRRRVVVLDRRRVDPGHHGCRNHRAREPERVQGARLVRREELDEYLVQRCWRVLRRAD